MCLVGTDVEVDSVELLGAKTGSHRRRALVLSAVGPARRPHGPACPSRHHLELDDVESLPLQLFLAAKCLEPKRRTSIRTTD
jgi:hypothetical protein